MREVQLDLICEEINIINFVQKLEKAQLDSVWENSKLLGDIDIEGPKDKAHLRSF
jgi:hypothetical protein